MTQKFRNIILALCVIFASSVVEASCPSAPAGYQTSQVTDTLGVRFSVYYPPTVQTNSTFNIFVCIANTNVAIGEEPSLFSFLPVGITNISITQTIGADAPTTINNTDTSKDHNGIGAIIYPPAQLGGSQQSYFQCVMQAPASPGTFTYTPTWTEALSGQPTGTLPQITINVITCPTITASGFTGCQTGSLASFVNGGSGPYTFFATGTSSGGTPTVTSGGSYSFTNPSGSFQYQAEDSNTCLSNVATVNVSNPAAGNDVLYTTSFGTPVIVTPNFTGGTAPYTFTTTILGNATTTYNSGTNQVTINQTAPGASLVQYTITDANGCVIDRPANIYVFSCVLASDTQVVAALVDSCIYSLCAPTTAFLGQQFTITATISNPNPNTSRNGHDFHDIVPDPTQVAPPCPCDPGLLFIPPAIVIGAATFTFNTPSGNAEGGMGELNPTGNTVAASTDLQVFQTIQATALGLQNYTAFVISNPNVSLPTLFINVVNCSTITAGNTAVTGCTNFITGNLVSLVTGGSGPYSFTQGTSTCTGSNLDVSGNFSYTAPTGFTGPCSFQYSVVDSNGCASNTGTVTLVANESATAINGSAFTCENTPLIGGTLSATGGTPPYTFAIVTNGSLGTAVITNATTGTFTYTPNANTTGNDSFTFRVTDSSGSGCVSTATESITINPNPETVPFEASGCVGSTVTGDVSSSVFIGIPPFIFGPTGAAVGGSVTINPSGIFTFTGAAGFSGEASFQYQVTDASGCIGTGVVDLNLQSPIAGNTSAFACVNGSTTGDLSVLVSGGFPGYTFTSTGTIPCGNVLIDIETGQFLFTPNTGFSGTCPFTYQVTDSLGCVATGEIDVTVASPIAGNTSVNDCLNSNITGDLTSLVTSGFPPYTFGPTGAPVGGSVSVNPSGIYSFTANAGFSGVGGFQYQVTDTQGCVGTGNVTVTVSSPIASNTAIRDCVNGSVRGSLASLVTAGFPPYTFSPTAPIVGGAVSISPTGLYNFTAANGFSGLGGFNYFVTDTVGCTAQAGVNVTILSPIAASETLDLCFNSSVQGTVAPLVSSGFPPYTFGVTGAPVGGSVTISPNIWRL